MNAIPINLRCNRMTPKSKVLFYYDWWANNQVEPRWPMGNGMSLEMKTRKCSPISKPDSDNTWWDWDEQNKLKQTPERAQMQSKMRFEKPQANDMTCSHVRLLLIIVLQWQRAESTLVLFQSKRVWIRHVDEISAHLSWLPTLKTSDYLLTSLSDCVHPTRSQLRLKAANQRTEDWENSIMCNNFAFSSLLLSHS